MIGFEVTAPGHIRRDSKGCTAAHALRRATLLLTRHVLRQLHMRNVNMWA